MDSYDIIVTPDAEADLFEIRDYIARTLLVPDVALNYIRTLQEEMQKLTYMASSIAPVEPEPWRSKGVRKIIVKNFYVLLQAGCSIWQGIYLECHLRKARSAQSVK